MKKPPVSYPLDEPKNTHPTVFRSAAVLIIVFVVLSLVFREQALGAFGDTKNFLTDKIGWFFLLSTNFFLLICLLVICTRRGNIRLGGQDAKPAYPFATWMAMLFSAGMGIGLVFWSVAEPILHFTDPPLDGIDAGSQAAAKLAQTTTFFHWGLHAWGIYALMGMALAYCAYNRGLPLTIRSTLEPLLGKHTDGPAGNVVDVIASVATLFGVATSLGFGVQQVNAGLAYVFGLPENSLMQTLLIAIITLFATISVVSGLDTGIRRLSEANMLLAVLLLLFVLIFGPTLMQLTGLLDNTVAYLARFPGLSVWFGQGAPTHDWQQGWTIFYWAWWISWSPFVGMFIARISRGRTLRQFTIGVLLVPTVLTFLWLSVFGNAGLDEALAGNDQFVNLVGENKAKALFGLLDQYPAAWLTSILGLVVIILFFVTSSDSGSLVIDIITAGGHPEPPTAQRIFWAVTEGLVAAVLLLVGGEQALTALQTASVLTGLPFALVLIVIAISLLKQTRKPRPEPRAP
ncbi:MAG: BCCT family transporter [Verrucomicrobiota bacterium JB023]|nr:BCCT family transporter [Verrucomicrobiota bacterium JB023]